MKKYLGILGGLVSVLALPLVAIRALGIGVGYKNEFLLNGRKIIRPNRFYTQAYKAAFELIGEFLSQKDTPNVLPVFESAQQASKKNFLLPSEIPASVLNEVLEFFTGEGLFEKRWQLNLADGLTPAHDPGGKDLVVPNYTSKGFILPYSVEFSPEFLTDDQKTQLIGKPYLLYPVEEPAPGKVVGGESIVISESNFTPTYIRTGLVLSELADSQVAPELQEFYSPASGD